jgi:hypothetical protein
MRIFLFISIQLIAVSALLLAGCGSDGSGGTNSANDNTNGPTPDQLGSASYNVQAGGPYDLDFTVSDFELSEGEASDGTDVLEGWETPGETRMLIATSDDGLEWERTGEVFIDQVGAPDAIVFDDKIFIYYMSHADGLEDVIVAAVSENDGETWVHKLVHIDIPDGKAADPAVAVLDDGTLRMYMMSHFVGDGQGMTRSAVSEDGINFYLDDGVRVEEVGNGQLPIAPAVILIDDVWHMYTLTGSTSVTSHLTSDDGLVFEEQDPLDVNFIFATPLQFDDVRRFYGNVAVVGEGQSFALASVDTEDGYTFDDPVILLEFDEGTGLEMHFLKEATVVELSDGSYMMFYLSAFP